MFKITDSHIKELYINNKNYNEKIIKSALCQAVSSLSYIDNVKKELIYKFAKNILLSYKPSKSKKEKNLFECNQTKIKTKSRRGRKPLHRGKKLLGGTKNSNFNFWKDFSNAIEIATNDQYFKNAQPKGNYAKTKHFLRTHWKYRETFTLPELKEALEEKYPENAEYNGFKLQRWGNAFYWENTGDIAIKPIWKKLNRYTCLNIFYNDN